MADIVYFLNDGLYLNITNECPCRCVFCVRDRQDSMGTGKNMWHDAAPDFEKIKKEIDSHDLSAYDTAVFCGYGEPTCAFENLIKTAKYLKEKYSMKIRVNTNGLGNLVNGKDITDELCENVDSISISLNAPDKEKYLKVTRSVFGINSYDEMLDFAKKCVKKGIGVRMTVVDILSDGEIEQCRKTAESAGAVFDARHLIK